MNFLQEWVNDDNKWVVLALLFGFGVLLLAALPRFGAKKQSG
jgi:hypothetical protein